MFEHFRQYVEQYEACIDGWLEGASSSRIVFLTVLIMYSFRICVNFIARSVLAGTRSRNSLVEYIQKLPVVRYYIQMIRRKVVSEISQSTQNNKRIGSKAIKLPGDGLPVEAVLAKCAHLISSDSKHTTKMSGAIYVQPESNIFQLCSTVYNMFAHTNPLHGDAFPAVSSMESDVVAFTASLLGSQPDDEICGNLTSGGTESILSAVRTSRDFMRSTRGIKYPEMYVDSYSFKI